MSKQPAAILTVLFFATALCGCGPIARPLSKSHRFLSAQYTVLSRPRLDVPGIKLGKGSGLSIDVWLRDMGNYGIEGFLGATRHALEGSDEDAWDIWLRVGWRGLLGRERPLFAYGALGIAFDVIDSEDFSTFVTYISLPPLPLGCYARAGVGARVGRVTLVAEACATASRVKQQSGDAVWFTTVAYSLGVGATF